MYMNYNVLRSTQFGIKQRTMQIIEVTIQITR